MATVVEQFGPKPWSRDHHDVIYRVRIEISERAVMIGLE
jgi:hypothetical protein